MWEDPEINGKISFKISEYPNKFAALGLRV
jgi:hypothetical protein